jgi:anti-sigma factor RsiW
VRARAHHLHDDRLLDCYLTERGGEALDPPAAEHLADCEACSARYAELSAFMDTVRRDGDAEADAVFTPERLRAQQQQIARRIEHVGRPARVISFPSRLVRRTIGASQSRSAPRWVAAAAAAGLFVGVAVGASYEWNTRRVPAASFGAREISPRIAPVATRGDGPVDVANDDAFLSDLEVALEHPHTRELQAFDAFTPHVREIREQR